ncbi:MAG: tRNA (adenosine(37)-N6)-dimethylallyltransferase MiaA [Desulfatiglandales bacterium]
MQQERQRVVVIVGPTASGKSSISVDLARRFGGEIVNADSMQVYRGMDIGTAKPSLDERREVPHHLFDVVAPDQEFNAAIYRSLALRALKGIAERDGTAFVVGGTGLYVKTLLGGLLECPPTDPVLRNTLWQEWEVQGFAAMHARLRSLDPESAEKIHPHDRVRILRAMEVIHLAGSPLSTLIRKHRFEERPFLALKICLQMDRERLYHRIDERCGIMVENGLLRETQDLLNKGYSVDLKPLKALGYRHMVQFLSGRWSLDEAVMQFKKDTRRYAKRQLTWFRSDPEMQWISIDEREKIRKCIEAFI